MVSYNCVRTRKKHSTYYVFQVYFFVVILYNMRIFFFKFNSFGKETEVSTCDIFITLLLMKTVAMDL